MAYITSADLEARRDRRRIWELANDANLGYDELQDDDDELATAQANVDAAIDDASAEIDEMLGERMDVPLAAPDSLIKRLCADMAMFFLAKRRLGEIPDDIQKPYDDALAKLETYQLEGGTQPPFSGRDDAAPFGWEEDA